MRHRSEEVSTDRRQIHLFNHIRLIKQQHLNTRSRFSNGVQQGSIAPSYIHDFLEARKVICRQNCISLACRPRGHRSAESGGLGWMLFQVLEKRFSMQSLEGGPTIPNCVEQFAKRCIVRVPPSQCRSALTGIVANNAPTSVKANLPSGSSATMFIAASPRNMRPIGSTCAFAFSARYLFDLGSSAVQDRPIGVRPPRKAVALTEIRPTGARTRVSCLLGSWTKGRVPSRSSRFITQPRFRSVLNTAERKSGRCLQL